MSENNNGYINGKPIKKIPRGRPPRTEDYLKFKNLYEKVLVGDQQPKDVQGTLGISHDTYYKWVDRYHRENPHIPKP